MKKSGKKLCALALPAAMLGLTACGSSSGTTDTTTAAAGGAAATEETTAAAAVAEGESVSQETDIIGAVNVDFTTLIQIPVLHTSQEAFSVLSWTDCLGLTTK